MSPRPSMAKLACGEPKHIAREEDLDRNIKRLGHAHHDISPKDPKYVVNKEASQEDYARDKCIQMDERDGTGGECLTKDITVDPILRHHIINCSGHR